MTGLPVTPDELVDIDYLNEVARAHWRKNTAKVVSNTVAETDLLNGEITIDAGAMSTNRGLRLTAWGDIQNNTGVTENSPRFRLKLGGTTLVDTNVVSAAWATHTDNRPWRLVAEIINLGAANSQEVVFDLDGYFAAASSGTVSFTTGDGAHGVNNSIWKIIGGTIGTAVDTSAAAALALGVVLPVASTSLNVALRAATVELL